MKYNYPACRKADLKEDWFGTKLEAPYTWLRDTNANEVKDFTARENHFTDEWFEGKGVDEMIRKLKAAYVPDPVRAISPWKDGYLASRDLEGNYSVVELDSNLQIIRTLFKRYDLPERTPFAASACPKDQNLLAIMSQVDAAPRPDNVIYDFEKKEILSVLPMAFGGEWSLAKRCFYSPTTTVTDGKSSTVIQQWDAETNAITDLLAFPGESIFGHVERSDDGRYFIFSYSVNYSDQVFYTYHEESGSLTALNEGNPLKLTYAGTVDDVHYFISLKSSDHGVLLAVPEGKTLSDAEIVYREENGYMDSGFSVNGKLFVHMQSCAASTLKSMPDGKEIQLPEAPAALSANGFGKGCRFFCFESFTSRPRILAFDGEKFTDTGAKTGDGLPKTGDGSAKTGDGSLSLLTETTRFIVPSVSKDREPSPVFAEPSPVFAPETSPTAPPLTVDLLFADSPDGTKIPYYLVHRKDAEKNSAAPALFYGYGGYNISMPPWSTEFVSGISIPEWVKDGGIYIHCLIRGGNEYGPAWHEQGMMMHKKNCYEDFIAIAEKVIADGWTSPSRTVVSGCSNGGLLVSALVTMRPDLWGCAIDSVPHTDMIHFADDDRGSMYITEYGNPSESREMFEYLLSYSPVHNVRKTAYPPVYVQTGECDNNVPPYHGKGFAAMLQAKNTADTPILLRVLEKGSHDRGQGEVYWRTVAEMQVFIREAVGR